MNARKSPAEARAHAKKIADLNTQLKASQLEHERQVEKLDRLRELSERGEAGERIAARNARRDQRLAVLEAKMDTIWVWCLLQEAIRD